VLSITAKYNLIMVVQVIFVQFMLIRCSDKVGYGKRQSISAKVKV